MAVILVVLFTRGCTQPLQHKPINPEKDLTGSPVLRRLSPLQHPVFDDDMNFDGLKHSINKTLQYLTKIPSDRKFRFGRDTYDATHMIRSMDAFLDFIETRPSTKELQEFIQTRYRVYQYNSLKFVEDKSYDRLLQNLGESIFRLENVPPKSEHRLGPESFKAKDIKTSLENFQDFIQGTPSKEKLLKYIGDHYPVYMYCKSGLPAQAFFTGYYEPYLLGSLEKSNLYRYPVHTIPDDLVTIDLSRFSSKFKGEKIVGRYNGKPEFVPYYERKQIEKYNLLEKTSKPLAWVDDKIDLFFLEIQGSGHIYLNDGQSMKVHYHLSNGRPYRSIGSLLIRKGKIPKEKMSMQSIRTYLKNNPSEVQNILNYNPSYIFFKTEEDGPLGSLNVKLTPGRSIATDRKAYPRSALAFIRTEKPLIDGNENIQGWTEFSRFVLNQDTGGAITGPGRADLYWGNGVYAEIAAGYMQHKGDIYFLVLDPDVKI